MVSTGQHPSFAHPGIAEALCEVHFQFGEEGWKPTAFGDLFVALQPDFPELEPVAEMGVQFQLGAGGLSQELLPAQQRVRYKHKDRQVLVHLSDSVFTVNVLPAYDGWTRMQADLLNAWERLLGVVTVSSVSRIGLRYINRLPKTDDQTVGDWLKASDYIPAAALSSLSGLLSRLEVHPTTTERRIVTVADVKADDPQDSGLVFDIDCIGEDPIDPARESIADLTDRLHAEAWRIFEASITPRLRDYLETGKA